MKEEAEVPVTGGCGRPLSLNKTHFGDSQSSHPPWKSCENSQKNQIHSAENTGFDLFTSKTKLRHL